MEKYEASFSEDSTDHGETGLIRVLDSLESGQFFGCVYT